MRTARWRIAKWLPLGVATPTSSAPSNTHRCSASWCPRQITEVRQGQADRPHSVAALTEAGSAPNERNGFGSSKAGEAAIRSDV